MPSVVRGGGRASLVGVALLAGLLAGCTVVNPPQPSIRPKDGKALVSWVRAVGYAMTEGVWKIEVLRQPTDLTEELDARSAKLLGSLGDEALARVSRVDLGGLSVQVLSESPAIVALRLGDISAERLLAALRPQFEGRTGDIEPSTVERVIVGDRAAEVYHYPGPHRIVALVPAGTILYAVSDRTDAGWQAAVRTLPTPPAPSPTPLGPSPEPWIIYPSPPPI